MSDLAAPAPAPAPAPAAAAAAAAPSTSPRAGRSVSNEERTQAVLPRHDDNAHLAAAQSTSHMDSLAVLLKALVGQQVVVELRNETNVDGMLVSVDQHMGLKLRAVVEKPLNGPQKLRDTAFIPGRQIRFVHLPDDMDVAETLDALEARDLERQAKRKAKQGHRAGGFHR